MRRADQTRDERRSSFANRLRNAEVNHLDLFAPIRTPDYHYIFRLEVAMNDVAFVGVIERRGDLMQDRRRTLEAEHTLIEQLVLERMAFQPFHHDVSDA